MMQYFTMQTEGGIKKNKGFQNYGILQYIFLE